MPEQKPHLATLRALGRSDTSVHEFLPQELFLELLGQAIDSGVQMLSNSGMSDEAIWTHYRAALEVLSRATNDIEDDKAPVTPPAPSKAAA